MGGTDSRRCPQYIADYIVALRSRFAVQTVILFGSRARGDSDQFSDWDLFVIAQNLPHWKQRVKDVWKGKPPGVDVIAWTPEEIRKFIYRTFIQDIALEGVSLYGDMSWMRQLAERYLARRGAVNLEEGDQAAQAASVQGITTSTPAD